MAFDVEPEEILEKFVEEGGRSKLDIRRFVPIRRRVARPSTVAVVKVHMIASVGGKFPNGDRWELVGGEDALVSEALADKLIVHGWAVGELSREWSDDEVAEELSHDTPIRHRSSPPEGEQNG